jgi:hypothetical protein
MSSTKLLSVLLAVVAVSALALGSAGFSSVSADRSVSVSVVDNEEAYVGVAACELGADGGTESKNETNQSGDSSSQVRLWVGNNFSNVFTVTEVNGDDIDREPGVKINPGELKRFDQFDDVDSMVVSVEAEDESFSAEVTVDVVSKDACPFERQAGESAK